MKQALNHEPSHCQTMRAKWVNTKAWNEISLSSKSGSPNLSRQSQTLFLQQKSNGKRGGWEKKIFYSACVYLLHWWVRSQNSPPFSSKWREKNGENMLPHRGRRETLFRSNGWAADPRAGIEAKEHRGLAERCLPSPVLLYSAGKSLPLAIGPLPLNPHHPVYLSHLHYFQQLSSAMTISVWGDLTFSDQHVRGWKKDQAGNLIIICYTSGPSCTTHNNPPNRF